MRKTVECLLVVVTALLFVTAFVSCRTKEAAQAQTAAASLSGAWSCTADVTMAGRAYTVDVVRLADGSMTLQFIKPAELSQLALISDKSGTRMRYGLMETKVSDSSYPQSSVCVMLLQIFTASAKGGSVSRQNDHAVLSGSVGAGPYTLTLSKDGAPRSLRIPSAHFSASLSGFQAG